MRRLPPIFFACVVGACSPDAPAPTPAAQIPEVTYGDLAAVGPTPELEAPLGATRVSLLLALVDAGEAAPRIEARGFDEDGAPTEWVPLEVTWREGAQIVARAPLPELSVRAQLRLPPDAGARIGRLTWSALVPAPPSAAPPTDEGALGLARAGLRQDIAALGVQSREEWGARATRCSSRDELKERVAIHHTVSNPELEPAAAVRGVQAFHMDGRGWCDIGYHFLVSLDGQTFEGRPVELMGAHVGGHNRGNIGVAFIGCFHPSGGCESLPPNQPPDVMVQAGADLVAGLTGLFDIPVSAATVRGHRDHAGASTACPGDFLHARLDEIRTAGDVEPPTGFYAADFVQQTFPLAREPFELAPGEPVSGFFELRNTGVEPWLPGQTFLAPTEPRDEASPLAGADWVSPSRAATVREEVAPGETGRFSFTVKAPDEPGTYPQFFGLVQEGVTWFSDAGQGGPPDDQLEVRVTVLDAPPWTPPPPPPAPDGGLGPSADAGPEPAVDDGGCSCRAAPRPGRPGGWLLAGVGLALGLASRRRR